MMSTNRKWNVSKYAWWDYSKSKWQVLVGITDSLMLILKGTQFLLINKKTVVESFDLIQKSKGATAFVRNGCLALVARCGAQEKYRKFKVLFDSTKDAEDCADCLRKYIKTVGGYIVLSENNLLYDFIQQQQTTSTIYRVEWTTVKVVIQVTPSDTQPINLLLSDHRNLIVSMPGVTLSDVGISAILSLQTNVLYVSQRSSTRNVEKPRASEKLEDNIQEQLTGKKVQGQGDSKPVGVETLPEILERIMSKTKPSLPAPDCIPEDYPLESAVRLCILDPGFPKLVEKVEAIIKNSYK